MYPLQFLILFLVVVHEVREFGVAHVKQNPTHPRFLTCLFRITDFKVLVLVECNIFIIFIYFAVTNS